MQGQRHSGRFIDPEENLVDVMKMMKPGFITLQQHDPSLLQRFPQFREFICTTMVSPIGNDEEVFLTEFETDYNVMLNMNVSYLISKKKNTYVQTLGRILVGKKLKVESFCETFKLLRNCLLSDMYNQGYQLPIKNLLYNYMVLFKQGNNYIQIAGPPLYNYLNYAKSSLVINKKNTKKVKELLCNDYSMKSYQISRRLILYHASLNRDPGLWRQNAYFLHSQSQIQSEEASNNDVGVLVQKLLIKDIKIWNILGHEERIDLTDILKDHFRRVRKLCALKSIKGKPNSKGSTFGLLLKKMCDLPANYQQLKERVANNGTKTPQQIQQIYNNLYAASSDVKDVQNLLQQVIRLTIPERLFGSENKKVLGKVLKEWIAMNRFQDYKIDDIMMRIDLANHHISWFGTKHEFEIKKIKFRRKKIVAWIICFLFRDLFAALLAANFYATEKHRENNRISFYRKQIWMLVSKLSITKFENNNLKEIGEVKSRTLKLHKDCDQNLLNTSLPCGKLRILPKKGSFRPIITFNSKNTMSGKRSPQTLNQYLFTIKIILRGLKQVLGSTLGYSVFDNYQIFEKYEQFYRRWKLKEHSKVAYFSLDIEKCYDSIDPIRLRKMIQKSSLIKDYYIIYKYIKIFRNKKPVFHDDQLISCFNAKERITSQSLDQNLFKINEPEKSCIYIYAGQSMCITKEEIISKLSEVCESLVVVYKNKRYRQTFGIPQGLNISGVLCSLYFAIIESSITLNDGLLMRLTDDYVFLGEEDEAERVLYDIMKLPAENSFKFNETKIKANFKNKFIETINETSEMEWIGKTFNLNTLQYFITEEPDKMKLKFAMNVNYHQAAKPQLYNPKHTFITLRNHLKNKLKSLLSNQFNFYFKPQLFNFSNLILQIRIYVKMSLYKFQPFISNLRRFHLKKEHKLVFSVYREAFTSFGNYTCSLFPKNNLNDYIFNTVVREAFGILIQYCEAERKKVFKPYCSMIRYRSIDICEGLNKQNKFLTEEMFNVFIRSQY